MKDNKTVIREYTSHDTDRLIVVWQLANSLAHPFLTEAFVNQVAIDIRSLYLPNADTWVLEEDNILVGFIALIGDEIGGLFLDPIHHGKGLGRLMVDHAVDLKGQLRVEVFERNEIGRRFYNCYGFKEITGGIRLTV